MAMDALPDQTNFPELAPGLVLGHGRFRLGEPVSWPMAAAVWLAWDESLNENVLLWFPQLGAEPAEAIAQLRRTIKAARALAHPHILRTQDFWAEERVAFAVTECVEAQPLPDWLAVQAHGAIAWQSAAELVRQLGEALAHAHSHGLVHGLLTPPNLLVTLHRNVKVCGFGLSHLALQTLRESIDGVPPAALSPQACHGEPLREADDIFSLGAVIELLFPATGDNERLLLPVAARPRLNALVRDCLATNPDHRPLSAQDVLRRFDAALALAEPAAPPVPARPNLTAVWQPAKTAPPAEPPFAEGATAVAGDQEAPAEEAAGSVYQFSLDRPALWFLLLAVPALLGMGWWLKHRDDSTAPQAKQFFQPAPRAHRALNPTNPAPQPSEPAIPQAAEVNEVDPADKTPPPLAKLPAKAWDPKVFFNGADFAGWRGETAFWAVEEQCLVARYADDYGQRDGLTLEWLGGEVGDFELRFQHRGSADAGVLYRAHFGTNGLAGYLLKCGQKDAGNLTAFAPRTHRRSLTMPGRRIMVALEKDAEHPVVLGTMTRKDDLKDLVRPDDWNDYAIIVHGNRLQHEINGRIVSDVTDNVPGRGWPQGALGVYFSPRNSRGESAWFRRFELKRLK